MIMIKNKVKSIKAKEFNFEMVGKKFFKVHYSINLISEHILCGLYSTENEIVLGFVTEDDSEKIQNIDYKPNEETFLFDNFIDAQKAIAAYKIKSLESDISFFKNEIIKKEQQVSIISKEIEIEENKITQSNEFEGIEINHIPSLLGKDFNSEMIGKNLFYPTSNNVSKVTISGMFKYKDKVIVGMSDIINKIFVFNLNEESGFYLNEEDVKLELKFINKSNGLSQKKYFLNKNIDKINSLKENIVILKNKLDKLEEEKNVLQKDYL